jgi:hypothetical protein
MTTQRNRIVVTGIGIVGPLGCGAEQVAQAARSAG